ncbi:kinesin-domain-containing protein [Hesseltinella vesiculosa]|uniref:Kinesin-like protein n=1 Tax=Hesseltinella vesiculosa TaxID=101127 RepID=A0A1X2GSG2_9FUNG|nr:kinesin-domain-containing protein [Hesseltinella vesiculosa]
MTVGLPPITTQHNRSRGGSNSSSPTYDNVLVGVRCRPLFPESDKTHELAWQLNPLQQSIQLANNNSNSRRYPTSHVNLQTEYHYDRVYYESSNEQVYQDMVLPLIQQTMDGYNATVFTYGQTASGKTHTMMGTDLEPGIIPQAVNEVFNCIKQSKNNEFLLRVSYLEIYNETIRDLLAPENDNLKIYEDPHRGTYVGQATEKVVTNPHEVMDTILCGETNRHISTTDYNLHSSRSHTLFQMVIESRQSGNTPLYKSHSPRAKASVKISQLNLIDLAGSEKAASNQDRRKEGAYINKSLLTLGTVIAKLTEPGKSAGHVPYRDSKLTRLLQSSLSGSARVVVICTISPTIFTVDESINTLKFASRVKKIVLRAKNEPIADDKTLLQQYKSEIDELKKKLQVANDGRAQEQQNNETMLSHERQQVTHTMAPPQPIST